MVKLEGYTLGEALGEYVPSMSRPLLTLYPGDAVLLITVIALLERSATIPISLTTQFPPLVPR